MQSEVARLISETLEQEKSQQHQQHLDDHYEHSTEEVGWLRHEKALTSEKKPFQSICAVLLAVP